MDNNLYYFCKYIFVCFIRIIVIFIYRITYELEFYYQNNENQYNKNKYVLSITYKLG